MKLHHFSVVISLILVVSGARAFQPLETGLEPLYSRLTELRLEMQPLDQLLKAIETHPSDRVVAYRRYVSLENEARKIGQEIERANEWVSSGLVNLLGDATTGGLTAPSSGQPSTIAYVER